MYHLLFHSAKLIFEQICIFILIFIIYVLPITFHPKKGAVLTQVYCIPITFIF